MEKVCVESFVVEMGRLCNRVCEHCLRGKMENVTTNLNYIKKVLNQVSRIGCITFTGGEPTMYAKEIAEIIDYIIENNIEIYDFYVASNGEKYSQKLMKALVRLYDYMYDISCCEITAFDVSNDQFHKPNPYVVEKLSNFVFFHQRENIPLRGIISEGYAEENGIGYRYLDYGKKFYVTKNEYKDETEYEIEMLYLNSFGEFFAECDYSYETQRNLDKLNCNTLLIDVVKDEDFSTIY